MRFSSSFRRDQRGATAPIFAIALPALLGAGALALDYALLLRYHARLQEAVDNAALSAIKELTLANAQEKLVETIALNYVQSAARQLVDGGKIEAMADKKNGWIKVTVSQPWQPFFAHYLSPKVTPVVVSATARIRGAGKLCVVGLAQTGKRVVHLDNAARLVGNDCGVYSNSTDPESIAVDKAAQVTAKFVCSAGGIDTHASASLLPTPTTDCPPVKDPLAERTLPSSGTCNHTDLVVDVDTTLLPGVYCGGLTISGNATVSLGPGIYVIRGGNLLVTGDASIKGQYVSFHLTNDATFQFNKKTTVDLTAPKDGAMAGILFFEDRANKAGKTHKISSDNARVLLGTIYLPRGELEVDAGAPVADKSAYTAIVATALKLREGPVLTLNTNYSSTEVPVPYSLIGGRAKLER